MVLFAVRFSLSIITEYHFLVNLTVLNFTESLDNYCSLVMSREVFFVSEGHRKPERFGTAEVRTRFPFAAYAYHDAFSQLHSGPFPLLW